MRPAPAPAAGAIGERLGPPEDRCSRRRRNRRRSPASPRRSRGRRPRRPFRSSRPGSARRASSSPNGRRSWPNRPATPAARPPCTRRRSGRRDRRRGGPGWPSPSSGPRPPAGGSTAASSPRTRVSSSLGCAVGALSSSSACASASTASACPSAACAGAAAARQARSAVAAPAIPAFPHAHILTTHDTSREFRAGRDNSRMEASAAKLRIALAQINTTVGDIDGNAAKIGEWIGRAREAGAGIVVFPEQALGRLSGRGSVAEGALPSRRPPGAGRARRGRLGHRRPRRVRRARRRRPQLARGRRRRPGPGDLPQDPAAQLRRLRRAPLLRARAHPGPDRGGRGAGRPLGLRGHLVPRPPGFG